MEKEIAKSALIDPSCTIGLNSIIQEEVIIGKNCKIGNNVIIHTGSKIGDNVRIDDFTIIGKQPMRSPRSIFKDHSQLQPAQIGNNCQIGSFVTIYALAKIGNYNLLADQASIRENVTIGDYNIIGRGVAIENYVKIGNRNKLETYCYITAYSRIEDYCFIAPAVATSNDNYLGRDKERFKHFKGITVKTGGRIGVNATILPGKIIEKDGVVAAASVATKDVGSEEIWLGNPARKQDKVPDAQLLKNNLDDK